MQPPSHRLLQDVTLPRTGSVEVADKTVRFTRPGLIEEYSVSMDGVRQDFIIETPPLNHQSTGELRLDLEVTGARVEATPYGARLVLEGSGSGAEWILVPSSDNSAAVSIGARNQFFRLRIP